MDHQGGHLLEVVHRYLGDYMVGDYMAYWYEVYTQMPDAGCRMPDVGCRMSDFRNFAVGFRA